MSESLRVSYSHCCFVAQLTYGDNRIMLSPYVVLQLKEEKLLLSTESFLINIMIVVKTIATASFRESVKQEVWIARRTLSIGIIIFVMVLLVSPILILLLRHTVLTIQVSFYKYLLVVIYVYIHINYYNMFCLIPMELYQVVSEKRS